MTILFWACLLLMVHAYFIYPLSIYMLGWVIGKTRKKSNQQDLKVSILVAVHNEEDILEEKIQNCLALEYPRQNLEILFGSDASTDKSNLILDKYADDTFIQFIKFDKRKGKSGVLNRLVPQAKGEILLFCDANTMLYKNTVQKLVSNFADEKVGCVCGRLILKDASGTTLGRGESLYWKIESEIKSLEGHLGVVIGSNGGIYAIRKPLFKTIPENRTVMDDFFVTTQILLSGKEVVYEPLGIGSEETSVEKYGEFKRKVRIGEANFNMITHYFRMLNPVHRLVTYSFFSHKFLRWLGPLNLVLIFGANLGILFSSARSGLYVGLAAAQVVFYCLAIIGYLVNQANWKPGIFLTVPFYFVSMNIALLWGLGKAILGSEGGMWERVERTKATDS